MAATASSSAPPFVGAKARKASSLHCSPHNSSLSSSSSGPAHPTTGFVESGSVSSSTPASLPSSNNSSPVVGLDLDFSIGSLGTEEPQWPTEGALLGYEFPDANFMNAFADLDGGFDSFTQGTSAVTNGSSTSSMNQQFTSSALAFPTLPTTAPLPVTDPISDPANLSSVPVSMQMPMPFHQSQLELVLSNPASNHSNHMTSASSSSSSPQSDGSPSSGVLVSRKRSRTAAKLDDDEDEAAIVRRQKNTLAARKYRQKRLDRIKELEDALAEITGERDDLRIRLARQEAETQALKALMAQLGPRGGDKKD